jgi:hypothetical protein
MKAKIIFSVIAMVVIMVFTTNAASAQSRSTIYGDANMVSKDNNSWALEVNGKVVTGYDYSHFQSTDGVYFAVEDKNGKWGVCDQAGTFLFKCELAKTYVNGSTAMLYSSTEAPPKIYDCKTKAYVKAEEAGADFFDKGRDFNPEKMTRDKSIEASKALSAQVAVHGKFEIRMKANSSRQELVVDGKVIWECQEFRILSTADDFNRTTCWAFIVKNNGKYGTFVISLYMKDGKKQLESQQFIPYEYSFIVPHTSPGMLECTTMSGASHYRAWTGQYAK